MQIQRARTLIEPASAIVQVNPLTNPYGLSRRPDDDAIFYDRRVRFDLSNGDFVPETDCLTAMYRTGKRSAGNLYLFLVGVG